MPCNLGRQRRHTIGSESCLKRKHPARYTLFFLLRHLSHAIWTLCNPGRCFLGRFRVGAGPAESSSSSSITSACRRESHQKIEGSELCLIHSHWKCRRREWVGKIPAFRSFRERGYIRWSGRVKINASRNIQHFSIRLEGSICPPITRRSYSCKNKQLVKKYTR